MVQKRLTLKALHCSLEITNNFIQYITPNTPPLNTYQYLLNSFHVWSSTSFVVNYLNPPLPHALLCDTHAKEKKGAPLLMSAKRWCLLQLKS